MTGGHLKDLKAEGQGIFEMNYLVQLVWLQRGGTQLIIQMGIMAHTKLIGQPDLREKFKPFTPNTLAHHGQTNAFQPMAVTLVKVTGRSVFEPILLGQKCPSCS